MIRRKDIASLIRNVERPADSNTAIGIASSIGSDGKAINGQNFSDCEMSGLDIVLPYGISSSGIDGIRVQIITNDNKNNVVTGVIDKNRPKVKSGCITIYDKSGAKIELNGTGDILINGISFNNLMTRINNLQEQINNIK